MNEILTQSGKMVSPIDPITSDIDIEDIAHSLSYLCRANGHFNQFYSVAQHSINCAIEARDRNLSPKIQLGCLLHDGAEAYMSDIPKPVKEKFPEFTKAENKLLEIIFNKFIEEPLTENELKEISRIDSIMLKEEFVELTERDLNLQADNAVSTPDFEERNFEFYKNKYLAIFYSLAGDKFLSTNLKFDKDDKYSYIGVDGCKGKWLAVRLFHSNCEIELCDSIKNICKKYEDPKKIIVDIPIGLPRDVNESPNRPDSELRKKLGKKSSSVFNTPFRNVVYAPDKKSAYQISEVLGSKISPLSLSITKYIADVDIFLRENKGQKDIVVESHPEYCFMLLNNNKPLLYKKSEEQGIEERVYILSRYYPDTFSEMSKAVKKFNNSRKKRDDILDALCLAICAKLGVDNGFKTIPEMPIEDEYGLKMQIVYPKMEK